LKFICYLVYSPKFQIGVREGDYKLIWGQPTALHRSYREAKEDGGLNLQRPVLELYNLKQVKQQRTSCYEAS
jgi:hypothetical protein